ncbi:MAG: zinc ribbon domain-containing protein [Lachnospiraceae bacterium]|nr:zinc ribbon domain-containing protein [Lachnospiraceae bacterium]
MFVIIGTQLKKEEIGILPQAQTCPRCQGMVHYQAFSEQRWFTIFWTSLFPIESSYYFQCPCCGLRYKMSKEQMMDLLYQQKAVADDCSSDNELTLLDKGARQAGRWYARARKYLHDTDTL